MPEVKTRWVLAGVHIAASLLKMSCGTGRTAPRFLRHQAHGNRGVAHLCGFFRGPSRPARDRARPRGLTHRPRVCDHRSVSRQDERHREELFHAALASTARRGKRCSLAGSPTTWLVAEVRSLIAARAGL
ncbi:MAG: hypothetical protein U1E76_21570 [Planctomycetota bacterium]